MQQEKERIAKILDPFHMVWSCLNLEYDKSCKGRTGLNNKRWNHQNNIIWNGGLFKKWNVNEIKWGGGGTSILCFNAFQNYLMQHFGVAKSIEDSPNHPLKVNLRSTTIRLKKCQILVPLWRKKSAEQYLTGSFNYYWWEEKKQENIGKWNWSVLLTIFDLSLI